MSALANRHFNHRAGKVSPPAASLRISQCTGISNCGEEDLFSLLGVVNSERPRGGEPWRCETLRAQGRRPKGSGRAGSFPRVRPPAARAEPESEGQPAQHTRRVTN